MQIRALHHGTVPGLGPLVAAAEAVAFWATAGAPFVYPVAFLLHAYGSLSAAAFVGLLAVHAVAIVVGHGYGR